MKYSGKTDPGLKRSNNQDFFLNNPERGVFVVADGMGGHAAGETASRMAAEQVVAYLTNDELREVTPNGKLNPLEQTQRDIRLAIQHANREIFTYSERNPDFRGMGTTVVATVFAGANIYFGHVGDSRLYCVKPGKVERVTKDHSRVQELIDSEAITQEEAERSPFKNIITKALGGGLEVEPDVSVRPFHQDELYLLCTDGLHGVVDDKEIMAYCYHYAGSPDKICQELIKKVRERGAPDNVTIVIIEGDEFAEKTVGLKDQTPLPPAEEPKPAKAPPPPLPLKEAKKQTADITRDFLHANLPGEERETRDHTLIYIGLAVILMIVFFLYLSQTNATSYTVQYDDKSDAFIVAKGRFFPFGKDRFRDFSLGLNQRNLSELVTKPDLATSFKGEKHFKDEASINDYLSNVGLNIAENLLKKGTEKDLQSALYIYNTLDSLGSTSDLPKLKAQAHYQLGQYYTARRFFRDALNQYLESQKLFAGIPKLDQNLAEARGALQQDELKGFEGALMENNPEKAKAHLDALKELGYSDAELNLLQERLAAVFTPSGMTKTPLH